MVSSIRGVHWREDKGKTEREQQKRWEGMLRRGWDAGDGVRKEGGREGGRARKMLFV